jgi:hypothetical protein
VKANDDFTEIDTTAQSLLSIMNDRRNDPGAKRISESHAGQCRADAIDD